MKQTGMIAVAGLVLAIGMTTQTYAGPAPASSTGSAATGAAQAAPEQGKFDGPGAQVVVLKKENGVVTLKVLQIGKDETRYIVGKEIKVPADKAAKLKLLGHAENEKFYLYIDPEKLN